VNVVDKWLNFLEGYFPVMILPVEKILLLYFSKPPHVKDLWETFYEKKEESTPSLFLAAPTWNSFWDTIKEQYYPIRSYEDKYIKWTMLRQGRDRDILEFTNVFIPFA